MVNWNTILLYRMPKTVTVQVWQVGLVHKICQVGVLIYLIYSVYTASTWALSEEPGGTSNWWPEVGGWWTVAGSDYSTLPYCSNPSAYSFTYSADYEYTNPECDAIHPFELVVKGDNHLHVTTGFIEYTVRGYPCPLEAASGETLCEGDLLQSNGQCVCTTSKMFYPVGVDEVHVAFSHRYTTTDAFGWWGSSLSPPDTDIGTDSTVKRPNGRSATSDVFFESGRAINFTVGQWLDAANVSLDDINYALTGSVAGEHPRVRTSGVTVTVTVTYDNTGPGGKPEYHKRKVDAEVDVEAEMSWAGAGPVTHFETYPKEAWGNQTFEKFYRYRQGVHFQFRGAGLVYRMEWLYLVNTLVASLVLLSAADTIATFFALYCMKSVSQMIRFDTREKFSVDGRNAELGMKAAIAAAQFDRLDDDDNGMIELEDLVRAFARIPGVEFEQAAAVAQLVLNISNDEDDDVDEIASPLTYVTNIARKLSMRAVVSDQDAASLSFSEFMRASVGGRMVKWKEFLENVEGQAKKPGKDERKRLKRAFDDEHAKRPDLLKAASGEDSAGGNTRRRRRRTADDDDAEGGEADGDDGAGGRGGAAVDGVARETPAERLARRTADRVERRRRAHDTAANGGDAQEVEESRPQSAGRLRTRGGLSATQ